MAKISAHAIAFLIPVALWSQQQTETIRLRNGTEVTGGIVSANERDITIRDQNSNTRRFGFDEVESIVFNGPRAGYDRRDNAPGNGGFYRDDRGNNTARPDNSAYRNDMTLQAGTEISVRTNGRIDSEDRQSRSYSAQVERDVAGPNGEVMIPRGSDAQLVVRDLGRNSLALDLDSITVNGRRYVVNTEDVTRSGAQGVGANKRTGEYVGGGAVLGTLLGAIAGGGKGAAIGALAGGAAGAGAQVITRGDHVNVPSETVLNFRLEQPLRLHYR